MKVWPNAEDGVWPGICGSGAVLLQLGLPFNLLGKQTALTSVTIFCMNVKLFFVHRHKVTCPLSGWQAWLLNLCNKSKKKNSAKIIGGHVKLSVSEMKFQWFQVCELRNVLPLPRAPSLAFLFLFSRALFLILLQSARKQPTFSEVVM